MADRTPTSPVIAPDGSVDVDQLLTLLGQQLQLYTALQTLSAEQSRLVQEGQVDDLLSVLARRQKLIEALSIVNEAMDPVRPRMTELWDTLDEARRAQLSERLDGIGALVKAILDGDARDRGLLESARGRVGAQIQQLAQTSRAAHAYRAPAPAPGTVFANHQG